MDSVYCYTGTDVLINKMDIKDEKELKNVERKITFIRLLKLQKKPIEGNFDLKHLQKIHKYVFQDLYEWSGETRNVNIGKGNLFCLTQNINSEAERIFNGIRKEEYLKSLQIDQFSDRLAYYSGEINALHPFREGNGRVTREFIRCLAEIAGYSINYADINNEVLFNAFVKSFVDYTDLKLVFKNHIIENIKSHYIGQLSNINNEYLEKLLNDLHEIKLLSKDGNYLSLEQIKTMYGALEEKVEKGSLERNDSTFILLSDITNARKGKNQLSESIKINNSSIDISLK